MITVASSFLLVGLLASNGCDPINAATRVGPAEVDHPVVWFPLDDPAAIGRDRSGNQADALTPGLVVERDPVRGPFARFDGGELVMVSPVHRDFTISLWIRTQQAGPSQSGWIAGPRIVDADVPDFHLDFGLSLSVDKLSFGVGYPNDGRLDMIALKSVRGIVDGAWHHVALTREGQNGMRQIFIDGVLDTTGVALPGELTLPKSITLGGDGATFPPSPRLRADLSDVRFYDQVLSESAIAFLSTL